MYHKSMGSYDEIPDGMKRYINNYGCHFNKKLCEEAVSRMYTMVNGRKESINAFSKERIDSILSAYNIKLNRNKMMDAVYVGNMCVADFLGKSIPDEKHLAMYIKDVIDDPDADDGYIFNAFYAKCVFCNEPIDWDEMI